MVVSEYVMLTPWIESGAFFFQVLSELMQASLLSFNRSIGSRSRKLHLCEQDYHKLLEFFFFVSVPPSRSSSLAVVVQSVKMAPIYHPRIIRHALERVR